MKKLLYTMIVLMSITFAFTSCKKDDTQPKASSNLVGDWTWHESVQILKDANGVDQPNPTQMSYMYSPYVHRLQGGSLEILLGSTLMASGTYTNENITIGNGGSNSVVYYIRSVTSNSLVIERWLSDDGTYDHYERTSFTK